MMHGPSSGRDLRANHVSRLNAGLRDRQRQVRALTACAMSGSAR